MKTIFQNFIELGHHSSDTEEEKIRKASLLIMSGPFAIAGLVWGLLYFLNGLTISGLIPFSYGLLSVASIINFGKTKKYAFFRNSQLLLILILPFLLQTSLGGFVPGSAVIVWAIIAPAGALIFHSIQKSIIWFAAYILLVVIAYLINGKLPEYINWGLKDNFINALFLMNIIGLSSIVFMIQFYFVRKQRELKKDVDLKNTILSEQSEKLKEMDIIKSRFFANISHEFRTPLTLILGLINKQIATHDSPLSMNDSLVIKGNAQRLLQLINQLLDLSKLESGSIKLEASYNDIVLFTKTLTAQFESFTTNKNIKLTFNKNALNVFEPQTEIFLFFDKEILQKILTNLLSNALKFTPENGEIAVETTVSKNNIAVNTDFVSITVTNTGHGIPESSLSYIFNRFYQVDDASNRQYEGTGIGLALVKELVELHHGQINVKSNGGITSFTIELPLKKKHLTENEIVESIPVESAEEDQLTQLVHTEIIYSEVKNNNFAMELKNTSENQLEILIVEDNTDLRNYIRGILEKYYKVHEAVDGKDGFEKATTSIPDLIISDVMMPEMDGYELCKKIKTHKETDHIPLILLTAKATRENKLEGLEHGADDYLVKPFDEEELIIRIKNLILIREKLQKKYQQEILLKPKEIKISSVHQKFLEDLKEIIEKNIDNYRFSIENLGKQIGMSRSQLHRKLKALTDLPATTFIRNYRLHRAADLLLQDAGNITEIAYQVGFSSQTYFSSSFNEFFGCPPSEYKLRIQDKSINKSSVL